MKIISNSGPLITLSQIDKLHFLKELYGSIVIPDMVEYEIVIQGQGTAGAEEIDTASWINVQTVKNRLAVELLHERLDAGESEAIILAIETNADLLLMDEARGRRISEVRGIKLIGTLGVCALAKQCGLITN